MRRSEPVDTARLVRDERRKWQSDRLIAPGALHDFQKLSDEAFLSMRLKYLAPADLVAEMRLRRVPKSRPPRKRPMG